MNGSFALSDLRSSRLVMALIKLFLGFGWWYRLRLDYLNPAEAFRFVIDRIISWDAHDHD